MPPSRWLRLWLITLLIIGCAAKHDPFKQQVERITNLSIQGEQYFSQGDLKRAQRDFSRALELSRAVDYPAGVAQQCNNLGAVALETGDLGKARELFSQAYRINQDQQNWAEASVNQANLATVAQKEGNLEEAWKLLQAAQEAAQKSNSKEAAGRVLSRWASFYLDQKDAATAAVFLQQAQGLAVTPALKGAVAHQWGRYYLAQGNTEEALAQFNRALKADREVLHRAAMAGDLFSLGETYKQRGEFSQAWEYYSRAFEVYAGLSQKTQMQRCLEHLKEVNSQGGLGHSLERFEKHPKLKPS